MQKYQDVWDDATVLEKLLKKNVYELGEIVGSATIPSLAIYEMPIYYGTTDINKN